MDPVPDPRGLKTSLISAPSLTFCCESFYHVHTENTVLPYTWKRCTCELSCSRQCKPGRPPPPRPSRTKATTTTLPATSKQTMTTNPTSASAWTNAQNRCHCRAAFPPREVLSSLQRQHRCQSPCRCPDRSANGDWLGTVYPPLASAVPANKL